MAPKKSAALTEETPQVVTKPIEECPLYYAFRYVKNPVTKEYEGDVMIVSCEGTMKRLVHKWKHEDNTDGIGPFLLTNATKLGSNRLPEIPPYAERMKYSPN